MSRGPDFFARAWARVKALGGRSDRADGLDPADSDAFADAARAAYRESATIKAARAPAAGGSPIDSEWDPGRQRNGETPTSGWLRARRASTAATSNATPGDADDDGTPDPDRLSVEVPSPAVSTILGDAASAQHDADDATVPATSDGATLTANERPTSRRRRPGDTAPESLLRIPSNVNPVTDDFFDGLIRRVEGDR